MSLAGLRQRTAVLGNVLPVLVAFAAGTAFSLVIGCRGAQEPTAASEA